MKVHLGRLLNCATTIAFGIPNQIDVCQKVMIFLHILMHLCAKISPSIVPWPHHLAHGTLTKTIAKIQALIKIAMKKDQTISFVIIQEHALNQVKYLICILLKCSQFFSITINWIIFTAKVCDGIVHCIFGEDEADDTCQDKLIFPEEATIQCFENRLGYDITIRAIPCDGVQECRDGSDEQCQENFQILIGVLVVLVVVTSVVFHYYKWYILDWKNRPLPPDDSPNDTWISYNCKNFIGNELSNLKVRCIM